MEIINSEKKQIMTQWKSSLIVLARCDEALQAGDTEVCPKDNVCPTDPNMLVACSDTVPHCHLEGP
eukprot:c55701_g1_i1 orf=1-198(+)